MPPPPPSEVFIVITEPATTHLEPLQQTEHAEVGQVKPVVVTPPPAPPKASRQGAYSPNLYQPGQCVWGVKNWRPDIPGNWHSAYQWVGNARADGWPTGSVPKVNAVGAKGNHVVLVMSVNADGTFVTKEMNQKFIPYQISSRTLSPAGWTFIY